SPLRYLELDLNAEWLRYYLAAKLNARVEDLDFNPDDFIARVNSDLIGKYVNIASRAAGFISRHFDGELAYLGESEPIITAQQEAAQAVQSALEQREYGRAVRLAMAYADTLNQAFDNAKPWLMAKNFSEASQETKAALQDICSRALAGFRALTIMLSPILPALSKRVATELFSESSNYTWQDVTHLPQHIAPFKHLMKRVDPKQLDALFDAPDAPANHPGGEAIAESINIKDFAKLDLRIAKIVQCDAVEGSDKLLRLVLDIGEERHRQVFSGIKSSYQ